jgi:hypothetical protein
MPGQFHSWRISLLAINRKRVGEQSGDLREQSKVLISLCVLCALVVKDFD